MNDIKRKFLKVLSKGERGQSYAYGGGGILVTVLVVVLLVLLLR
jgi:hypothetical protein